MSEEEPISVWLYEQVFRPCLAACWRLMDERGMLEDLPAPLRHEPPRAGEEEPLDRGPGQA